MSGEPDPHHQQLDALRSAYPVYFDQPSGCFFLTRYEDIRSYLLASHSKDPDTANPGSFLERSGKPVNPERPDDPASIGYMDPPQHGRIRSILTKAFYKRINNGRSMIERVAEERLDRLAGRTSFDVVEDFAIPLPLEVFGRMLGLAQEELPQFRTWAIASFNVFQTTRTVEETFAMNSANEAFSRWLDVAMAERRLEPQDDLVTDLVETQGTEGGLTDGEIRANCVSLVVASTMTTTDVIGSGVRLLLDNPAELSKLRTDPELIRPALEEILRVEPPIESEWRVATHDLEIRGCPVRMGQVVAVSLNGGNRDPEVFADPHRFDITREHKPHMAFGVGEHICVGAPLGRLTAQLALSALLRRCPDLALADPAAPPDWRNLPHFRGLTSLRVVVPGGVRGA